MLNSLTEMRTLNPLGGQWTPVPPVPGLTPILEERTVEQLEQDWRTTAEWVSFRCSAERVDNVPRELWYTDEDPEWPAHLYRAEGVDPVPPPILHPLLEFSRELHQSTRFYAMCMIVGMDTAAQVLHEATGYAMRNRTTAGGNVSVREEFAVTHAPNDQFIEIAFGLTEFATRGITDLMLVDFAEKFYIEQRTLERGKPGGDLYGLPWGWRPIKIVEALTGLAAETVACVGTPAMHEDPEGHSAFWRYLEDRITYYLNGDGVDAAVRGLGAHGGLARVGAGVHTPASSHRGERIGALLSAHSDPAWERISDARLNGWPLTDAA